MCVDIELDNIEDLVPRLKELATDELKTIIGDKCSATILAECETDDYDELAHAVGKTILNSIIVKLIVLGVEHAEENEDETQ